MNECSATVITANPYSEIDGTDRLQLILDCFDMGIWSYDSGTGVFSADERVREIFGADRAEGDLTYWLDFVHQSDRRRVVEHFQEALSGDHRYDLEYRLARRDCWIRSKGRIFGTPVRRMIVVVEDITDRKRLEEQLRTNEEGMRLAQEAGDIASWDWNARTGEFSWYPRGTRVYGRPSGELCNWMQSSAS